jgi:hypothetical protein
LKIGERFSQGPTYSLVVYYLDDSSQLSIIFTTLDDHDATNFNKFPRCRFDVDSGHSDESAATKMSVLGALQAKQTFLRSQCSGRG